MAKGGRRSGCFEAGGILCGHRARTAFGPIPSVRTDALSRLAEVCRDLWRAECVTKGACSVRGGATGDRWLRDHTAPVVYSTEREVGRGVKTAARGEKVIIQ